PTRAVSKAGQLVVEAPRRLEPNNNPQHRRPSNRESKCSLRLGRAVARPPAEPAEQYRSIRLPVRTTAPKAMLQIEIQPKSRNAVSSSLFCYYITQMNELLDGDSRAEELRRMK